MASKITQQDTSRQANDLTLIPGIHVLGGENCLLSAVL